MKDGEWKMKVRFVGRKCKWAEHREVLFSPGATLQSDEIIGILKVLFRYLGIGTRLATCSVNWMEAREFAILVPDPIAFAPWLGELL